MTRHPLGRYECPGQAPIVVIRNGALPGGYQGPWVCYRFEWERDEQATPVLWTEFQALRDSGYRPVGETS